jgi:DNA-binding response OmpR family regulator
MAAGEAVITSPVKPPSHLFQDRTPSVKGIQAANMNPYHVLLILPDQSQYQFIAGWLATGEFDVQTTRLGKTALEVLDRGSIDLVISDWDLPDLTSLAVIQKIRSGKKRGNLPIVVLNNAFNESDKIIALVNGADLCLTEMNHPKVFLARIHALLRRTYQNKKLND